MNLSGPAIRIDELSDRYYQKFLGGNGFGAQLLFEKLTSKIDHFGEENMLIFATGPLNGTLVPMASKFCVVSKSPLTETFMDGFSSGRFSAELKYAVYDLLSIKGIAETPVSLFINDQKVIVLCARHLWGLDTLATQECIRKELGISDLPVVAIGPAGENKVRYACIMTEQRAVGSRGLGAVMGSKNIKAIAVRGTNGLKVHDPDKLMNFSRKMISKVRDDPAGQVLSTYGTSSLTMVLQCLGGLPTHNWQKGQFDGSSALSAEVLMDGFVSKNLACFSCMSPCGHYAEVKAGQYRGSITNGPEFQGIGVFGPLVGNKRMDAVIMADRLCDELGLGEISAGVCIVFAMECYEKGIITRSDLDGLDLKFGNHKAMIQMLQKIATRQGFGDILAEGVKSAAKIIGKGSEEFAIHVKGMEMPCFFPRVLKSQALGFAVSSKGPSHNEIRISSEIGQAIPTDLLKNELGSVAKKLMDWSAIANSLVWCLISERLLNLTLSNQVNEMLYFVTGMEFDESELIVIADRIHCLERTFNVREGLKRKDDTLPKRFFNEPLTERASSGKVVNKEKLDSDISRYYRAMGWNEKGVPDRERLYELGLKFVADSLYISMSV